MAGPASSERPLLSVIMIVRDEERNLPRCLQSLRGLGAELVVIDTGSVDGTRQIARSFGAKLHEFPWTGDEAAARNVSVAHATGRWLFQLDADEELSPELRDELAATLPEIDAGPFQAGTLVLKNLYLHGTSSRSRIVRIGRAAPGYAFSGIVHPTPAYGQPMFHLRGELIHYGYQWTPEVRIRKGRRLVEQLERRSEAERATLRHYSERLMALLIAGEEETFQREWARRDEFPAAAKLEGSEAVYWSHALGNALIHFTEREDFTSGAAAAAQMGERHPGHVRAAFYLIQGAALREEWARVGVLARGLRGFDGLSGELQQAVPDGAGVTARAWEWLAGALGASRTEAKAPFPVELWQPRLLPVACRAALGSVALGLSDKVAAALLTLLPALDGSAADEVAPQADRLTAAALRRSEPGSATHLLALAIRFRLNRRRGALHLQENTGLLREALAHHGTIRWLAFAFPRDGLTEPEGSGAFAMMTRRALARL